jgi:hypothetical protein
LTANSIAATRLKYAESSGIRAPAFIVAARPETRATAWIGCPSRSQYARRARRQSTRIVSRSVWSTIV